MKKLVLPLLISSILTGCASFPADYQDHVNGVKSTQSAPIKELEDRWAATPALTFIKSSSGESVRKIAEMPRALADKAVTLSFEKGAAVSLADLLGALRRQGVSAVARLDTTQVLDLGIPEYTGTLSDLFEQLGQVHNIAYEYRNGVIFITETSKWVVTMPQHEELLQKAVAGLTERGVAKVSYDLAAGKIFFEAKPDVINSATDYIASVSQNAAMVTLQVAVLTVGHNRDRSVGFDWASLALAVGSNGLAPGVTAPAMGTLAQLKSTGAGLTFASNHFSLTAAINAMSKYGTARTDQNVTIGTLSGMPVNIKSGNEIPYINTIGSSIGTGGAVAGSTNTAKVNSGLELSVTPYYDNTNAAVVTDIKVKLSTLVGFRELSAGNSLGTLSQPEMQTLTFENVGRMAVGDTIVVGGLSYDQLSNNYQTLPGLEAENMASSNQKVNRQTIYIVVRPTIVMFTPDADKLSAAQAPTDKSPSGPATPTPVDVAPGVSASKVVTVDVPSTMQSGKE